MPTKLGKVLKHIKKVLHNSFHYLKYNWEIAIKGNLKYPKQYLDKPMVFWNQVLWNDKVKFTTLATITKGMFVEEM